MDWDGLGVGGDAEGGLWGWEVWGLVGQAFRLAKGLWVWGVVCGGRVGGPEHHYCILRLNRAECSGAKPSCDFTGISIVQTRTHSELFCDAHNFSW